MTTAVSLPARREAAWLPKNLAVVLGKVDVVLAGLLVIGAWLRLFRIGEPDGSLIFDEAYYVQDARVILGWPVLSDHISVHAQSGLDPNLEHPPLAKLLIAASMYMFGSNAFAWRLPSVILGVLSIWTIYRLVLAVGGDRSQARLASFVMAFDCLAFVHGRIATLDVYVLAFMLLGTWLYVSRYVEAAGVALGLATLCKVNGAFGVAALLLFELAGFLRERKKKRATDHFRSFAVMTAIYVVFTVCALGALDCAFTPFRSPIAHFHHILSYGASLTRSGGMQGGESTPVQWWLNEAPINYLMVQTSANGLSRTSVLFRGALNEYVIFAAPLALAFAARGALRGSRFASLAVCLFLANYVPVLLAWALASRVSYIFYMLQSVPAIALAIAFASTHVPPLVRWTFVALVVFSFAMWFPFRWY